MKKAIILLLAIIFIFGGVLMNDHSQRQTVSTEIFKDKNTSEIYLAGGCFWGVEAYMAKLKGVVNAESGYANGNREYPSYQDVCNGDTGFAETVHVNYDPKIISLKDLLNEYFKIINPLAKNQQGNDIGSQYRTGIYYTDSNDKAVIEEVYQSIEKKYNKPLAVEKQKLENFYLAEDYHQDYLEKHPNGYCHINLKGADKYNQQHDN